MRTSRAKLYLGRVPLDNPQRTSFDPFGPRVDRALTVVSVLINVAALAYIVAHIVAGGAR